MSATALPISGLRTDVQVVSPIDCEADKNKLFVDQYGARADYEGCEKDIPVDTLIQRVESAAAINKALNVAPWKPENETVGQYEINLESHLDGFRDVWLEIDSSQVPRLVKYEEASFFKKDASFFERMKTKYRFYRREFHRERNEKVIKLIRLQDRIAMEFSYEPFNSPHPLQELRDRCRRLETLQEERKSLSRAMKANRGSYNDFLSKLFLIERVFFFVISWVHSWFQKPYTVEIEISEELSQNYETLNEKGVNLGETKITFEGQEIPVEIKARFSSYTTVFAIYRQNVQLGCFTIAKKWTHVKSDGYFDPDYFEGKAVGKDVETLENPRLYIQCFENPHFKQDPNGDRPIMRLMTQIAVENIFQLEADNMLEIGSNHCDADVYFAGGFAIYGPEDRIKSDIQKARGKNKLFPDVANRKFSSFTVHLKKSSSLPQTRFVTLNEQDQEQPAKVDFELGKDPVTWEAYIQAHRLLPKNGPILPKFFLQDLSRFVKPPQRA